MVLALHSSYSISSVAEEIKPQVRDHLISLDSEVDVLDIYFSLKEVADNMLIPWFVASI